MVGSPDTKYYRQQPAEAPRIDQDLQLEIPPDIHTVETTIVSGAYRTTKESVCFDCILL